MVRSQNYTSISWAAKALPLMRSNLQISIEQDRIFRTGDDEVAATTSNVDEGTRLPSLLVLLSVEFSSLSFFSWHTICIDSKSL
jgi:hypothetical protein